MSKKDRFYITEIFMAKAGRGNAGFDRCFHGTIKRGVDADGHPFVFGKIKVNDCFIYASAPDQWELGAKLDQMVLLILDYNLHNSTGKSFSSNSN